MKIILILIAALVPHAAMASGACYGVAGDARSFCMAKAKRDPSYCYSIQNAGTRAACFAEVSR